MVLRLEVSRFVLGVGYGCAGRLRYGCYCMDGLETKIELDDPCFFVTDGVSTCVVLLVWSNFFCSSFFST